MRETREWKDYGDDEIRSWCHTEIGLSFVTELHDARETALMRLVAYAEEGLPTAATAGAIGILDRILFMLRETP